MMLRRVRGLETEYGLTVRVAGAAGWRRVGSDEAAQILFRPVTRSSAASSVFLRNGGRLYLDVGSHPEYATAECDTLTDLVAQDAAGDAILDALAARAEELAAAEGQPVRIDILKNNLDSHGNSWGSHENYQVERTNTLDALAAALTPFLVTRQVIAGAGRWTSEGFRLSQRSEHMWEALASTTTRTRPMINTRDEPHADPQRFRRLHVIVGDSNLAQRTLWLRIGATELALRAIESGRRFEGWQPDDPGAAIRLVNRDPRGRALFELAGQGRGCALDVQRAYWAASAEFVTGEFAGVHRLWGRVLAAVADDRPGDVAADVEWIAKRTLLDAMAERHGPTSPKLAAADLAWHEVRRERSLSRRLVRAGQLSQVVDSDSVTRAIDEPPTTTRAALRSAFIRAAQAAGRDYSADWMAFSANDLPDGKVICPDPLTASDPRVDRLIERMRSEPRRR